jgi:hypothetical protein
LGRVRKGNMDYLMGRYMERERKGKYIKMEKER